MRDGLLDVADALRGAQGRAARLDLGERDWRVLMAVVVLTASWTKVTDETTITQLAALAYGDDADAVTGWQRKRVGETLRRLSDLGVIGYQSGRGPGSRCAISLTGSHPAAGVDSPVESHPAAGCGEPESHPAAATNSTLPSRESHPADAAHREVTEELAEHACADENDIDRAADALAARLRCRPDTARAVIAELVDENVGLDTIRRYLTTAAPAERGQPWTFARRVRRGEQLSMVGLDGRVSPLLERQMTRIAEADAEARAAAVPMPEHLRDVLARVDAAGARR